MRDLKASVYIKDGNKEIPFNFYNDITVEQKVSFVNIVTSVVISDGNYYSCLKNVMFDFAIVKIFTDISTNFTDEISISDIEKFLAETNVAEIVKANISPELLNELNTSVDDNIAYITGVKRDDFTTALAHLIYTLEHKIKDIDMSNIDKLYDVAQNLSGISGSMTPQKILEAYGETSAFKPKANYRGKRKSSKEKKVDDVSEV